MKSVAVRVLALVDAEGEVHTPRERSPIAKHPGTSLLSFVHLMKMGDPLL